VMWKNKNVIVNSTTDVMINRVKIKLKCDKRTFNPTVCSVYLLKYLSNISCVYRKNIPKPLRKQLALVTLLSRRPVDFTPYSFSPYIFTTQHSNSRNKEHNTYNCQNKNTYIRNITNLSSFHWRSQNENESSLSFPLGTIKASQAVVLNEYM